MILQHVSSGRWSEGASLPANRQLAHDLAVARLTVQRTLGEMIEAGVLLDKATVRRGKHKGEATMKLRPETISRLETLGRERALIYKTLVLTPQRRVGFAHRRPA